MSYFRRTPFLAVMLVIAIAISGVTSVAQVTEPVQDSAPKLDDWGKLDDPLSDMKWYAEEWGIDLDEAARRFELQDAAGELDAKLSAQEQDTFAGLWIEHAPPFRIVVQFTRGGEKTIQPYVKGGPLADVIEVRTARVSLVELRAARDEALRAARGLGIDVNSGINVFENRVELYIVETAQLEPALQKAKIQLPDSVRVIKVDKLATQTSAVNLYGGLSLSSCTSGFPILYKPSSGIWKGVTTAGHCTDDLTYEGKTLYRIDEEYGGSYDIQWHWGYGSDFTVKPWFRSKTGYYRYLKGEISRDNQALNEPVCKYGKTSEYECGYLIDKEYFGVGVPNNEETYMRLHRDNVTLCEGGDSGGPVFYRNDAFGTIQGEFDGDLIYMAINYLDGLYKVTLYLYED